MVGRPPALWRTARILRILGYAMLAVVIIFVATAVYFALEARPQFNAGQNATTVVDPNSTVEVTLGLNLTNPGAYPISGVGISAQMRLPGGAVIARGGSPDITVAPASTVTLPIHLWVPLDSDGDVLLTHDVNLTQSYWANATFASLFDLHFNVTQNSTWGAPFYQFNATPGEPEPQSNGTVEVPVTIAWQDAASFGEQGTVLLQVDSAAHQVCGSSELPVAVDPGAAADLSTDFFLSSGCDPAGGAVTATYSGEGLSYTFPPEAIP